MALHVPGTVSEACWRYLGALSLTVFGCGDDPSAPGLDAAAVAGDYSAIQFVGEGEDVLAAGGSLVLGLSPDGTVSGQMKVPATISGGPIQADMSGSFRVSGDRVTFQQAADTFVRDTEWVFSGGTLTDDASNLEVVLER